MSDLSEPNGGFVSSPSERTKRNLARIARNAAHVPELVCTSERCEAQIKELYRSSGGPDEGQLNNRKWHEPSHSALALRQTQNNLNNILRRFFHSMQRS